MCWLFDDCEAYAEPLVWISIHSTFPNENISEVDRVLQFLDFSMNDLIHKLDSHRHIPNNTEQNYRDHRDSKTRLKKYKHPLY